MNYSQLFETIKGYVENDFPSTTWTDPAGTGTVVFTQKEQIDTFIQQAEQRIYNTIQFPAIRKNSTGTTTAGNKYLQQPSDFLYTYSLAVIDPVTGIYEYLLNKDVNFIREAFPYPAVSGKPTHYAYFDDNTFILGPTPDLNYTMELHYGYYPESIVTAGTTWLGDNMDSLLLYGALLEAYTFMKGEPDILNVYNQRYAEAITRLKNLGEGRENVDAYRDGLIRVKAT